MKPLIEIRIADEEFERLPQGGEEDRKFLARLLEDELTRFDAWAQQQLGGTFTRLERAAVKTYIYQKLVGRVDNLDQKPIDAVELAVTA